MKLLIHILPKVHDKDSFDFEAYTVARHAKIL